MSSLYFYATQSRLSLLSGPDAQDFLHRLSTVNTRQLAVNAGQRGFLLSANGKIRAAFHLWRIAPDSFAMEYDTGATGSWGQALSEAIQAMTFAEQMTLEAASETNAWDCLWILTSMPEVIFPQLAESQSQVSAEGLTLCHHGSKDFGLPWVSVWGPHAKVRTWLEAKRHETPLQEASPAEVQALRIEALSPWVDYEILADAANPLELGLTDGISQQKGCYPGQEVIERISALGAPARRLVLIRGEGASPLAGDKLLATEAEVGQVTSAIVTPSGFSALALLKKQHASVGLHVTTSSGSIARVEKIAEYQ